MTQALIPFTVRRLPDRDGGETQMQVSIDGAKPKWVPVDYITSDGMYHSDLESGCHVEYVIGGPVLIYTEV